MIDAREEGIQGALRRDASVWRRAKETADNAWALIAVPSAVKSARKLIDAHDTLESYLAMREEHYRKHAL